MYGGDILSGLGDNSKEVSMKKFLFTILALTGLAGAEPPPTPTLTTFFYPKDEIFGMYWFSAGSDYTYTLAVNEFDGWGWFDVFIWNDIPRGTTMSAYTIVLPNNYAVGRVRVEWANDAPEPRGVLKWNILRPIKF